MNFDNLLEESFPESYTHFRLADEDMAARFRGVADSYGLNDREGWMPSSVYSEIDFQDYDNMVVDLSTLINSFLGQGMRVNADIANDRIDLFRENLESHFFEENFEEVTGGRALQRDVYPSEAVRLIAEASEDDLDVFYPSSFDEYARSAFQDLENEHDYEFFVDADSHDFDNLKTYLAVSANDILSDLQYVATSLELPETEDDYNDRVFEAANNLDGNTALVTQSGATTDLVDDFENVVLQTPELARNYQKKNW